MLQIDDVVYDRARMDAMSGRWADTAALADGAGRRIAVCLPDQAQWLALLFAIRRADGSVLPIHPATPYAAARRLAEAAGCHKLFFGEAEAETFTPSDPEPVRGELLQMTSGTTGAPKCVARAWGDIARELDAYVTAFDAPDDMTPVIACPTSHSYGLICGVLAGLRRERTPIVVDVANPKRLLRILRETERPLLYASPAVLHTLARLSPPGDKIHAAMTSGTLLPAPWFAEIRAKTRFLFQQYGCSEAGCVAVNDDLAAPDEMGRPLPHLAVSAGAGADAPAEIVVSTPRGDVRTRDLGHLKPDGTLVFVARLDDTINVSGLNVYPKEVEDVAIALPGVEDAVAFRVPDGFAGERVGLLVSGSGSLAVTALMDGCRRGLASHQLPVEIVRVTTIPRQANGKISRRDIAALHASGALAQEIAR